MYRVELMFRISFGCLLFSRALKVEERLAPQAALLNSQRRITPFYLREIVENIPASQAVRTLKNSQTDHDPDELA